MSKCICTFWTLKKMWAISVKLRGKKVKYNYKEYFWAEERQKSISSTPHCGFRLRFALSILILITPNSWIRRLCYNKPSKTCLHIAPTVSSNFQEDAALQSVLKLHNFHDVLSQNILCSLLIESKHTLHSSDQCHIKQLAPHVLPASGSYCVPATTKTERAACIIQRLPTL